MRALWDERLTPADAQIIKHKASKFAGRSAFGRGDIEDLQQEVALHVFPRMSRFDPARGSRAAFVATMAKHRLIHLAERQGAQRRDRRRERRISDHERYLLIGGEADRDRLDVQLDVRSVLETLTPHLQQIALRSIDESEQQIATALHLTRGQVRHRLGQIANHFTAHGLRPKKNLQPSNQPVRRPGK